MNAPSTTWERAASNPVRLASLRALDILDTPAELPYDRITELMRLVFECEYAIISLIDDKRQWYKSCVGLPISEEPIASTFCRFILVERQSIVVPDARLDIRFLDHPKVVDYPFIRFYAGAPIIDRLNEVVGTVCVIDKFVRNFDDRQLQILESLAAMVMHELELRQEAGADPLTGANSRRRFKIEASRQIALANRYNRPLSCVTLDIDHFKLINDTHGHPGGDTVLVQSVEAMRGKLRDTDLFGRIGGEEFSVLLPNTDSASAVEIAERLRKAVMELEFDFPATPNTVTISLGVTSFRDGDSVDSILKRSDDALYQAKRSGRNRTCLA